MKALRKTIYQLTVFSIAMGFLESSVVIYLRELYYPAGFQFPLVPIPGNVAMVEFLREAATIIMLTVVGIIAGKNTGQRFAFFLFCFAVWDIFYYLFLKIFLDWPSSLLTWDILFIIPVPWVGPVIAPCIVSLTMIALTLIVVFFHERDITVTINYKAWLLLICGSVLIVASFIWDYIKHIQQNESYSLWSPGNETQLFKDVSNYIPSEFNWFLFICGELILLAGIIVLIMRHKKFRTSSG